MRSNIHPKPKAPRRRLWIIRLFGFATLGVLVQNTIRLNLRFFSHKNYGNANEDPTAVTFARFPDCKKNNSVVGISTAESSTRSKRDSSKSSISIIVVQLRGEMGNHLSSIAHGRGIQLWALEQFGIETRLMFRRQISLMPNGKEKENPKGLPSRQVIQKCFVNLQDWGFQYPVTETEYQVAEHRQQQELAQESEDFIISKRDLKKLGWVNGRPRVAKNLDRYLIQPMDIKQSLDVFQRALHRIKDLPSRNANRISLPFLVSDSLDNLLLMDRYLDHFRYIFALDSHHSSSCCRAMPDPNESVFHYRNFATELAVASRGLEETTPNQTAQVLFGHLKPGDKVAITSRFDNEGLQVQVQALKDRGLRVRVVLGQSGIQDFCFLLHAQKELVGNFQSTFALWAAVLGRSRRVRLYTVNSRALQQRYGTMMIPPRFLYKWTHPDLKDRVQLQLIEEDDGTAVINH
jgi:hypothetical protein